MNSFKGSFLIYKFNKSTLHKLRELLTRLTSLKNQSIKLILNFDAAIGFVVADHFGGVDSLARGVKG